MSLLSKSCVYGVRAAVYVAANQGDRPYVPIHEIAEELNLSFHFLTKILQQLTESEIMRSYRGPKGGVALTRPASKISLLQIVESIDGPEVFTECVLGLAGCGELTPCPLHDRWTAHRAAIKALFAGARLAEVSRRTVESKLRIAD
jgi:Rrf2 family protein